MTELRAATQEEIQLVRSAYAEACDAFLAFALCPAEFAQPEIVVTAAMAIAVTLIAFEYAVRAVLTHPGTLPAGERCRQYRAAAAGRSFRTGWVATRFCWVLSGVSEVRRSRARGRPYFNQSPKPKGRT